VDDQVDRLPARSVVHPPVTVGVTGPEQGRAEQEDDLSHHGRGEYLADPGVIVGQQHDYLEIATVLLDLENLVGIGIVQVERR
jgi:hypothetical protein